MGSLVDALGGRGPRARPARRSGSGTRVVALERDGAPHRGHPLRRDAPDARRRRPGRRRRDASAGLLADEVPAAAAAIRAIPHGSTGVVTLGYREEALPRPLVGHGFLVAGDEPLSFGACTFTSSKWAGPGAGRHDPRSGRSCPSARLPSSPATTRRSWPPSTPTSPGPSASASRRSSATSPAGSEAMPRYTVGHLDRVAAAEAALAARPEIAPRRARAFHGVGVPECVARGRAAAAAGGRDDVGRRAPRLPRPLGAQIAGARLSAARGRDRPAGQPAAASVVRERGDLGRADAAAAADEARPGGDPCPGRGDVHVGPVAGSQRRAAASQPSPEFG